MRRRLPERVEIVCPACGLIAEVRGTNRVPTWFCDCPAPPTIIPVTRPRICVSCSTVLNRYNRGAQCNACRIAGRTWDDAAAGRRM